MRVQHLSRSMLLHFFRVCGPYCDPNKCDGQQPAFCGCAQCTEAILDLDTGNGATCFDRILDRIATLNIPEVEACQVVSEELPRICGPFCNPKKCDGKAPAHCSCNDCTDLVLDLPTPGSATCFENIQAYQGEQSVDEDEACRSVSTSFPEICGPGTFFLGVSL